MKLSRPETTLAVLGGLMLAFYGLGRADAALNGQRDLAKLESAPPHDSLRAAAPSQELLGALSIPALAFEVPLYADTSALHLNRGVGLIPKTAGPDEGGNVGIAGHRDGSFRVLERIRIGDSVDVMTRSRFYRYRIVDIAIVDRSDARLLQPTAEPAVTLVTCHPFYFAGHAPRRFVARGVLISSHGRVA